MGVGVATHEYVERGVADFGPSMAGDVALCEDRDAGDALGRKAVSVQVQERGASGLRRVAHRLLDGGRVIEVVALVDVDDQVGASVDLRALTGEVVGAVWVEEGGSVAHTAEDGGALQGHARGKLG